MQILNDEDHATAMEDLDRLLDQGITLSDLAENKVAKLIDDIEAYEKERWPMWESDDAETWGLVDERKES